MDFWLLLVGAAVLGGVVYGLIWYVGNRLRLSDKVPLQITYYLNNRVVHREVTNVARANLEQHSLSAFLDYVQAQGFTLTDGPKELKLGSGGIKVVGPVTRNGQHGTIAIAVRPTLRRPGRR